MVPSGLEKKLKAAEKEILRKNDALAEMAALMMLKKVRLKVLRNYGRGCKVADEEKQEILDFVHFYAKIGIVPSYSRPRVSDDNPFIESFFKTLKYTPGYPKQFNSIEYARKWFADFVDWYNNRHWHSGMQYITPMRNGKSYIARFLPQEMRLFSMQKKNSPIDGSNTTPKNLLSKNRKSYTQRSKN